VAVLALQSVVLVPLVLVLLEKTVRTQVRQLMVLLLPLAVRMAPPVAILVTHLLSVHPSSTTAS